MRSSISAQSWAGEHALEFERLDPLLHGFEIRAHGVDRFGVTLGGGQFQHLLRFGQPLRKAVQRTHDSLQPGALTPKTLRPFRIVPDVRVFEFAVYFFEAVALGGIVKDTP
jgi:hypothetical protein